MKGDAWAEAKSPLCYQGTQSKGPKHAEDLIVLGIFTEEQDLVTSMGFAGTSVLICGLASQPSACIFGSRCKHI